MVEHHQWSVSVALLKSGNGCAHRDRWNPMRTSAIQSRTRSMRFLDFYNNEKGAPRSKQPVPLSFWSLWQTVCSTFLKSGWSAVRSASPAKGGTSKKRPSLHLHKVPTPNNVSPRTLQTALVKVREIRWILALDEFAEMLSGGCNLTPCHEGVVLQNEGNMLKFCR
jgi:hypothetical protein